MRDLIDLVSTLFEAQTLDPNALKKRDGRFEQFLKYIEDGNPFYTEAGDEVTIDPSEVERLKDLNDQGMFAGTITMKDTAGKNWPLGKFLKTPPFGQAVPPGQEADDENTGKEALVVKPSQIGITDKNFKASQLGKMIVSNTALQSTPYGQAVIQMAYQIMDGQPAVIPEEFRRNKALRGAIIDYAGEYLGVLAMVHGTSDFPKKDAFIKWLGGDLGSLTLNFPSKANTPLADSFATVTNPETQKQINISSKGQGGGAAPSMSGLKVPDEVRGKKKFKLAVDFIDLMHNSSLPKPASVSQIFQAMNLLNEYRPELIPEVFKKYLPWDISIVAEVMESVRNKTSLPRYQDIIDQETGKGTDGGKVAYSAKKAIIEAFNSGAIPEFQAAVLEILDMNFIQQYADIEGMRTGVVKFYTQWPAKLDGVVTVETKSGATDPTKGAFSFKLKPPGSKADPMPALDDDDNTVAKPSTIQPKTRVKVDMPGKAKPEQRTVSDKRAER